MVAASGTVVNGFQVFNRSSGRYGATTNGVRLTTSHADLSLIGRVNPTRVTTKVSGTAGARSFVRISDGSTLVSAG